jgi:hypothetical protein
MAMPCLLTDVLSGGCKSSTTSCLVHLNFCYWRCVEVVFDTEKILGLLFMTFVIRERIIEKNFKKIYKEKTGKRTHYTSKAKQGNGGNAEWSIDFGDTKSSSFIKTLYLLNMFRELGLKPFQERV